MIEQPFFCACWHPTIACAHLLSWFSLSLSLAPPRRIHQKLNVTLKNSGNTCVCASNEGLNVLHCYLYADLVCSPPVLSLSPMLSLTLCFFRPLHAASDLTRNKRKKKDGLTWLLKHPKNFTSKKVFRHHFSQLDINFTSKKVFAKIPNFTSHFSFIGHFWYDFDCISPYFG